MIKRITGYQIFRQWKKTSRGRYRNWSKLSRESKLIFDSTAFHANRICGAYQFQIKLSPEPIIDVTLLNDHSQSFLLTVVYFTNNNRTNFLLVKAKFETNSLYNRTPRPKLQR